MKRLLAFLILAAVCCRGGGLSQMNLVLPDMKSRPCIDGVLARNEWKDGVRIHGLVKAESSYLSGRQGTLYFGMDGRNIYFAAETSLPPKGVPLLSRVGKRDGAVWLDDGVEFLLVPPDEKFVYHFIVNPRGAFLEQKYPVINGGTTPGDKQPWDPVIESKSVIGKDSWVFESRIALAEFGMQGSQTSGMTWKVLAGRNWQCPGEQTSLKDATVFTSPEQMATLTWKPGMPYVSFTGLGQAAARGDYQIGFLVSNPGTELRRVQHRITVVSDSAPRNLDSVAEIPAKTTVPVTLAFAEKTSVVRTVSAEFRDVVTGQILFRRKIVFDPKIAARWNDPNQKKSATLEIGVYPYYGKIKARFGNPAEKIDGWNSGVFRIQSKYGKIIAEKSALKNKYGFEAEFSLRPAPGHFELSVELSGNNGRKLIRKQAFKIEKFPWEHNQIGCERMIIPPYCPIVCSGDRSARTLMTGYHFRDGFFDRVKAGDTENLLAAPVSLFINGEKVREKFFEFTEKSQDRVKTCTELRWKNGSILINGTMDFDGFYRFTMEFRPDRRQRIESAVLTIPLKNEYAGQIHSTCNKMHYNDARALPQKSGVIWRSSQTPRNPRIGGNFRPYIWVGNLAKGLVWLAETDRFWSLDPAKDAQEIIAFPDRTELRIHLVNASAVWEKNFSLEQAFQATPVRPLPDYRRRITERVSYPNGVNVSCLAGAFCWGSQGEAYYYPLDHDYSYVNYLAARKFSPESDKKMVEEYLSRHGGIFTRARQQSLRNHLYRGIYYAKRAQKLIPYLNARCSYLEWPEYETYMDEWWCSEYRERNADGYNNTPVKSYQDMALYYLRKLLREGMDGLYYDNIRDWHNANSVTGPAYRRADGLNQPYFDFFSMREFIRRTAVMLCQEKKVFPDGRPIFTCHMTNTNIVPFLSLCTIALDLEDQYGSKDFQDRFSEDYYKTCALGLQTGAIPEILAEITGRNKEFVTRTFTAVTLAYDFPYFMNCGGVTQTYYAIWRRLFTWGYSTPEVTVTPCWEQKSVQVSAPQWRVTTYRKGRELVAAVSSFGDGCRGTLKLPGQSLERAVNWENGQNLPVRGDSLELTVGRHDFILVHMTLK